MGRIMGEVAYKAHMKRMATEAGIRATTSKRRGMERRYFEHHNALGVRLRGKYRPS